MICNPLPTNCGLSIHYNDENKTGKIGIFSLPFMFAISHNQK